MARDDTLVDECTAIPRAGEAAIVPNRYDAWRMSDPNSRHAINGGNAILVIQFGSIAAVNLLQQSWLDAGMWGALAAAMVLMNDADLSQPRAWRRPRYLLGIALTVGAVLLLVTQLVSDFVT
jgi:hypothetical protein